ncbi:MAG: cytochrome c biogenesis protein ResB [PVC group bacterium]|nr:cytochrome c biogenesis protein ResB [PVC group bacterium]
MKYFRNIGSLKTTFFLLLVLAAVSMLGTLIVQDKPADFYSHVYGEYWGRVIFLTELDNLYNGIFYQTLLVLLGINLAACMIGSFQWKIFKNRKKCALFLLHASVFFIFIGGAISKFKRHSAHYKLLANDKIKLNETDLIFKRFNINFHSDTDQPAEYRSEVEVLKAGKLKQEKIIRVNHPITVDGYQCYQSGFESLADVDLSVKHMGKLIWQGKLRQGESVQGEHGFIIEIEKFAPDVLITGEGKILSNSYKIKNAALLVRISKNEIFNDAYWVFLDEQMNKAQEDQIQMFDFKINRLDVFYSTILHVVKDPGLPFVWAGFFLLLSGMTIFLLRREI